MPRFTKLPVTIEAVRFNGFARFENNLAAAFSDTVPLWLVGSPDVSIESGQPSKSDPMGQRRALYIKTAEGKMEASPGDWIIQGVKGELYPCKPDIFAQTYQPAED